jgi:transglutaminase-like putative cysteine protease
MWLRISCDLTFNIAVPTPFVFMLRPRSEKSQWIAFQEYKIVPSVAVSEFTDIYGNLCQRLMAPVGNFAIHTAAEVMTADYIDQAPGAPFVEVQNLPESVLIYLLPSRYCEADHFSQMAMEITAAEVPGYDQVAAITAWIRRTIRFESDYSHLQASAVEVHLRQSGVCRDLAHLAIAMCRSLSIPARMAVGYLHGLEPMDMHAWFEAYVGESWYAFDATQAQMRGGYVVVGYGRDAADVAVYNQFGPALYLSRQEISVSRLDDNSGIAEG